jgi:hypothetical protein
MLMECSTPYGSYRMSSSLVDFGVAGVLNEQIQPSLGHLLEIG